MVSDATKITKCPNNQSSEVISQQSISKTDLSSIFLDLEQTVLWLGAIYCKAAGWHFVVRVS